MIYRYDGTFQGLLSVLSICLRRGDVPRDIQPAGQISQNDLFSPCRDVRTDLRECRNILTLLEKRIGPATGNDLCIVFVSDLPGREMVMYRYCAFGIKAGPDTVNHLCDERVTDFQGMGRRVRKEAHRFLGLVRFSELEDGLFYSRIEPDHDIVPLIAQHFRKRLGRQLWIVHDVRRKKAAVHTGGELMIVHIEENSTPVLSHDEMLYRQLWKQYVGSISIGSRENRELQLRNMPLRYWKHLTEMG